MSEFVIRNGLISKKNVFVTGSVTAQSFTGSIQGTSSFSLSSSWSPNVEFISSSWSSASISSSVSINSNTSDFALIAGNTLFTSSFAILAGTSDFALIAGNTLFTSSYAITSSHVQNGLLHRPILQISSSQILNRNIYTYLCNATSSGFSVSLPSASLNEGVILNIKKVDLSNNAIIIQTSDGVNIDYMNTQTLIITGSKITIHCDKSQWWII